MKNKFLLSFIFIYFIYSFLSVESSDLNGFGNINKPNASELAVNYFKEFVGVDDLILGSNKNGKIIKITIKIMPFSKYYPKQFSGTYSSEFFQGTYGNRQPKYLISNIKVWCGGQEIEIPLSAYLDLVEIHKIYMQSNKNNFNIVIEGGDAGNSYEDELIFKNEQLIKRIIRSAEDNSVVNQETNYYYNY